MNTTKSVHLCNTLSTVITSATLIIICSAFSLVSYGKNPINKPVLIITHHYNCPEFITYQWQTFKKFLHDDYEFVVFNDATDHTIASMIGNICKQLDIQCIRIPQQNRCHVPIHLYSQASTRHAQALHYSMNALGFKHQGIVMVIDADMFLIKDFSVKVLLQDYDIAGLACIQGEVMFLWPGLLLFNMSSLPNKASMQFFPGSINNKWVDTGGYLHHYLTNNPTIKKLLFDPESRLWITDTWSIARWSLNKTGNGFIIDPLTCHDCLTRQISCNHYEALMTRLGINQQIIDTITAKKFPPHTELFLNGTFLHYKESSQIGASGKKDEFHSLKSQLLQNFLTTILQD